MRIARRALAVTILALALAGIGVGIANAGDKEDKGHDPCVVVDVEDNANDLHLLSGQ